MVMIKNIFLVPDFNGNYFSVFLIRIFLVFSLRNILLLRGFVMCSYFIKQFNQFFSSSIQVILWFLLNQLIDSFDRFYDFNYTGILSIKISWMCC